ncbi:SMI1/KNR4 family protein [Jeotgalibacillus sp. ET6]|uniref:SMI1/KNR4 family protein n=1 Tax=Jeotgalibacillus sp. ET6 TaxID=3037260 RepID=UPI0024189E10|nr:SMI1/KNR4 family protein [Jeotgalibacillus sp. ET6]MDG5471325.1 SMI1/KNR4 family protein [Jeotgalibacillus sp. ET6]
MKKIWQDENDYFKLEPLTTKAIEKAEKMLKVKLPAAYIDLLKLQNGGMIIYNAFPVNVQTSWGEDYIHIEHILGVAEKDGIMQSEYLIEEWGLPKGIVLFSGDGHSWIAFDYRKTNEEPPIIYIDTEREQIIELAPHFSEFLNGLFVENEELEDGAFEYEKKEYTLEEVEAAFASNDEQELILALDYLHENSKGNEYFIEQQLLKLLQSPILEFKQLAANVADGFNETGVLSPGAVEKMVTVIRKDKDIEYYADMFFPDN